MITAEPAVDEPRGNDAQRRVEYGVFAQDEYYARVWEGLLDGRSTYAGFNGYAAVFGMAWCFFRKLYWIGIASTLAVFAAMFLLGVIGAIVFPRFARSEAEFLTWVWFAAVLCVRIPLGFLANKAYFAKATKAIDMTRAQNLPGSGGLDAIRELGGTSVPGLVLAVVITTALRILDRM